MNFRQQEDNDSETLLRASVGPAKIHRSQGSLMSLAFLAKVSCSAFNRKDHFGDHLGRRESHTQCLHVPRREHEEARPGLVQGSGGEHVPVLGAERALPGRVQAWCCQELEFKRSGSPSVPVKVPHFLIMATNKTTGSGRNVFRLDSYMKLRFILICSTN